MAFRRRRGKPSVAWLPVLGQNDGSTDLWLRDALVVNPGLGAANISTNLHSLVPDYPAEAAQVGAIETMADYQGSGYRLRRIVGKFFCGIDPDIGDGQATIYPEAALVAAGLIILRVDTATGAPLQAATPLQYSPLGRDNVRDPWIWRRSWLLGNSFAYNGSGGSSYIEFPFTTADYGSAYDGPHIDQKTARRVALEERLILCISAVNVGGLAATTAGRIRYVYDARYLTSPLRVSGNRRNASR